MNPIRYNTIWCLFLMLFVAISCKDDMGNSIHDGIKMRVSVTGGSENSRNSLRAKASASGTGMNANAGLETQTRIISLSNGLSLVAELIPEQQATPIHAKQSAGGLRADASEVRNALPVGTQYRLLVYDANGNEVKRFDKTVDANSSTFNEFTLDATGDKTRYTFVVYSAGIADLPPLAANTPLNDASVAMGGDKFMHFVQQIDLGYGSNDLDVVLANKLSEITTVLDGQGLGLNAIKSVGKTVFKKATHSGGTLKLSDGTMTYSGTAQDKKVSFPVFSSGQTDLSSFPTVLVHSKTTAATLNVAYIEVDGRGKSEPFEIKQVDIEPGVKYNLVLRLNQGRCLSDVAPTSFATTNEKVTGCLWRINIPPIIDFSVFSRLRLVNPSILRRATCGILLGNWGTHTLNNGVVMREEFQVSTEANAGVVVDVTKLDNSFNMIINDETSNKTDAAKQLATQEIRFQTTGRNVRFADGTYHGDGTIPEIWEIQGSQTNPVIRVSISTNGEVSMEGRKSNDDDPMLYPMELFNGASFNNVTWRTSGALNEVIITQTVSGKTYMQGSIGGKKIGACN